MPLLVACQLCWCSRHASLAHEWYAVFSCTYICHRANYWKNPESKCRRKLIICWTMIFSSTEFFELFIFLQRTIIWNDISRYANPKCETLSLHGFLTHITCNCCVRSAFVWADFERWVQCNPTFPASPCGQIHKYTYMHIPLHSPHIYIKKTLPRSLKPL